MYKAIFSVLLFGAGLASGAQEGHFGTMGGTGTYGSYGSYWGSGCGYGHGYGYGPRGYGPSEYWSVLPAAPENTLVKDLEKRVGDLTGLLQNLTNRERALEERLEQQTQLSDLQAKLVQQHKDLEKAVLDAIGRINNEAGDKKLIEIVERRVTETVDRRINEIVERKVTELDKRVTEFDRKVNELVDKKMSELVETKMRELENKLADLKHESKNVAAIEAARLERIEQTYSQHHGKIDLTLNQILADLKGTGDTFRKVGDLEARLSRFESNALASKQEATQIGEILKTMVSLLEKNQTVSHKDIERLITTLDEKNKAQAKVEETPIRGGFSLNRSLIMVELPSDAKLMVDNHASIVGSNLRTFISPELEAGKTYFYNLHVEVTRNNRIFVTDQKIFFQPGREYRVNFENIETTVANSLKLEKGN